MDTINRLKRLGAAAILIALLSGCSEDKAENTASEKPIETDEATESEGQISVQEPIILEVGAQQFKIFSYYDAFDDYVELAKEQPEELDEVYFRTISQPFRQNAFGKGRGLEYMNSGIFTPVQDIISLQSRLEELSDKKEDIHLAIKEALINSAELLSGNDKMIHIFVANPANTYKKSFEPQGIALNEEVIALWVYPTLTVEELKHTIAHEYFHLIDMEKGTFKSSTAESTLLEATVMEGKAEAFALLAYPDTELPQISNEDGKLTEEVRTMFMDQKDSVDTQVWLDFVNGNSEKDIPPFANYIIGYGIMQSFLQNHPEMDVSEWLGISAEEILAGSDFVE